MEFFIKTSGIVLASLLLVAHSVSGQKPGYDIKVQIEGIQDTAVLLGYHYGSQKFIRDTSEVSNGLVHFKGFCFEGFYKAG